MPRILMVEDSASLAAVYQAYLQDDPYRVLTADSLGGARDALGSFQPDIVLLDIELPDGNGMDFLADVGQLRAPPRVIVMTAHGSSDLAEEAVRRGASDFLTKPFDAARLRVTLSNAASRMHLDRRISELASLERDHFGKFIGSSLAMQSVYKTIDLLAASDATGFIVGESGTGKELAVEAIHERSPRRDKPFIAINCGAIPGELIESELFGHVKGAFTGADAQREGAAGSADGGTLFLDEICEMDLDLQKKLLRFIQTGTFCKVGSNKLQRVDVRFLCATNRDPLAEVREGRFREDLYYRLHVVPVRMPPLRERNEDVLMIARHFLRHFSDKEGKAFEGFTREAEQAIRRYPWPGNVRQLQNAVHQLVVLNSGPLVEKHMLPDPITSGHIDADNEEMGAMRDTTPQEPVVPELVAPHVERRQRVEPLWLIEKNAIEAAIEACDGNVNQAAGLLEVAPSTIYRKLQNWNKART
ncbi:MAG: sigma-54 dependent transcriptional regulator [Lysobacterales bacterium]